MGIVDFSTDENWVLGEPPDWWERTHVEAEEATMMVMDEPSEPWTDADSNDNGYPELVT